MVDGRRGGGRQQRFPAFPRTASFVCYRGAVRAQHPTTTTHHHLPLMRFWVVWYGLWFMPADWWLRDRRFWDGQITDNGTIPAVILSPR